MTQKVVGLFGTCGDSKWREDVAIPILKNHGVEFFNPVVPDWKPEHAEIEAKHAAEDAVIMLVITDETTAIASMAESGWLAAQAILRKQQLVVVLQDMKPEDDSAGLRINKTRNLIRKHIDELPAEAPVELFADIAEATTYACTVILGL